MADLYQITKGKAYSLAATISGKDNADAKAAGFKDVFDYIMSDSDHPRQPMFLIALNDQLSEGHRKILLDGWPESMPGWPIGWPMLSGKSDRRS